MRFTVNPFSKRLDAFEADVGPVSDVEFLAGDAGGNIPPTAGGVISLLGTAAQGISTLGAGNTLTWTIADATTTQKGVSELATSAETIAGADTTRTVVPSALTAKLGTQTLNGLPIGAGTAAAVAWTAAPTNGQILVGSTGVTPVLTTITAGTGIAVTNGAGSVTIASSTGLNGTGTTVGAVTADLITFALGAVAGNYTFQGRISGFESTTPGGLSGRLISGVITTGAAGTEISSEADWAVATAALGVAGGDLMELVVSGNNVIIRITGIAGLTINWNADFQYTFVS